MKYRQRYITTTGKIWPSVWSKDEIFRRQAGPASKRPILERLMQEARRLLGYSSAPITEISYQLGFNDPAWVLPHKCSCNGPVSIEGQLNAIYFNWLY